MSYLVGFSCPQLLYICKLLCNPPVTQLEKGGEVPEQNHVAKYNIITTDGNNIFLTLVVLNKLHLIYPSMAGNLVASLGDKFLHWHKNGQSSYFGESTHIHVQ